MNINGISTKPHYEILDGLRGVAAVMILLFHIFETHTIGTDNALIIGHGYLAVDFFFALSGFVIGYAYDDRWGKMSVGTFFKRRLIRLHPLVIFGMILGAALFYLAASPKMFPLIADTPVWKMLIYTIAGMLMIPTPPSIDIRGWREMLTIDAPAWTLFFEYIANILYALVIRRFSRAALAVLVILSAGATVWQTVLTQGDVIGGWEFTGAHLKVGFIRLFYPFFAGLLLYRVAKIRCIRHIFPICCAAIVAIFLVPRLGGKEHLWMNGLYEAAVILFAFPATVWLGACGNLSEGRALKFCRLLGKLSFPLYITHYPVIYAYTAYVSNNNLTLHESVPAAIFVFVASIAIAYAALKLYDEPVRRWLGKKTELIDASGSTENRRARP